MSGLVCKNFINFTQYIFNMLSDIDKDLLTVLQGTLHKLLSFKIHSYFIFNTEFRTFRTAVGCLNAGSGA